MKTFRLVVVALAFLSLTSPLAAATAPSEEAFLRSLAQAADAPQVEEPPAGFGTPAPSPRTCTITRACGDGNSVGCTGNYSCVNTQKGVKCDTMEYPCPNYCVMSWTCEDCPNYVFSCWSLKGDCGVTASGCDGRPQRCICPDHPEW